MRPAAVTLALVLLAARDARAGCACEAGYVFRHVVYHAGYFGGHCTLPPMEMLRHRGKALLLDELVAEGISKGELPNKRLDVRHAEDWSNPHSPVSIAQNRNAMFRRLPSP